MATQFCELLACVLWCLQLSKFNDVPSRLCVHAMFDAVHLHSRWRMSAHARLLTRRLSKQYVKYTLNGLFMHLARHCLHKGQYYQFCQGMQRTAEFCPGLKAC